MKTYLQLAMLASGFAVAGIAAPATETAAPAHPRAGALRAFAHAKAGVIAQKLNLTADQKTAAKTLRSETAGTIKAIHANTALSPEQRQAQIQTALQSSHERMRALLTPDQQTKLADLRSDPQRLNFMARNRARTAMVIDRLALTPEQQTKVQTTRATAVASAQQIRADTTLTPEQRQAKLTALRQTARGEFQAALTPEQQAKLLRVRQRLHRSPGPL